MESLQSVDSLSEAKLICKELLHRLQLWWTEIHAVEQLQTFLRNWEEHPTYFI